jgi:hypothetical protein
MQPPTGPSTSTAPPVPAKSHPQHTKFNLRPLNDSGANYSQWCKMITLMLKYKGLWDIIDGSTPAPVPADAQGYLKWTQHD